MTQDRPSLGIALMLGFCFLAPFGDGIAKVIGDTYPLAMLLLARFGIQAVILLPLGRPWTVPRHHLPLIVLRTVLHIVGIGAMFLSLRFLPLADAVAIAFVMPFVLLLLGHLILNEEVGPVRLSACAVGFVGTLLVIQPNFTDVGAAALLPLSVAVTFAGFILVTRMLAKECDPIALQGCSGWIALALLAPLIALTRDWPELTWVWPTGNTAWLLLAVGIIGTLAHLLMSWSLRYAPASTLAPMQYLEIPVATVLGYLMFNDFPNGLAALGIVITIAAGLFIVVRERAMETRPRPSSS